MSLDLDEAQRQVEAIARNLKQAQADVDAILQHCHECHKPFRVGYIPIKDDLDNFWHTDCWDRPEADMEVDNGT